jgi:hypothetical protein
MKAIWIAAVASICVHGILFFALSMLKLNRLPNIYETSTKSQALRVVVVPKSEELPIHPVTVSKNIVKARAAPQSVQRQESDAVEVNSVQKSVGGQSSPLVSTSKWLPTSEMRLRWQAEGFAKGVEGENGGRDAGTLATEGAQLSLFAREFSLRFSVPVPLRRFSQWARAQVTVERLTAAEGATPLWRVSAASGDSYFRALLFETLQKFLLEPEASERLAGFTNSRFVVAVEFNKARANGSGSVKMSHIVYDSRFVLHVKDYVPHDEWMLVWASQEPEESGFVGLDLIGLYSYIAMKLKDEKPEVDWPEMEALRRSPAFFGPIPPATSLK